jgi:hypothetical protein
MDESNLQVKAKSIYDEIFKNLHNLHNAEFQMTALNLLRHTSIEVLEWIIFFLFEGRIISFNCSFRRIKQSELFFLFCIKLFF